MLTLTQVRYWRICQEKIATGKTDAELAAEFGVDRACVCRALAWGRRGDLFTAQPAHKLQLHIAELRELLEGAEQDLRIARRAYRASAREARRAGTEAEKRKRLRLGFAAARECRRAEAIVLDVRTRVMELEGLYRKVLNIQHSGEIGGGIHVYLPDNARGDRKDGDA